MTTAKAVLGVLAGMAAGVAIGVLLAPDKGSATRRKIIRTGEDLADKFEDLAESVEERMEKRFDEMVDTLTGKIRSFKAQADAEVNKRTMAS